MEGVEGGRILWVNGARFVVARVKYVPLMIDKVQSIMSCTSWISGFPFAGIIVFPEIRTDLLGFNLAT